MIEKMTKTRPRTRFELRAHELAPVVDLRCSNYSASKQNSSTAQSAAGGIPVCWLRLHNFNTSCARYSTSAAT